MKDLIGQDMNYHKQTVYNNIRTLVELGVILRIGRSDYAINPKFFYQGDPKLREKRIQDVYKLAADYKAMDIHEHNGDV